MNGQRDSLFLNEVLKRLGQAGDDNLRLQRERDVFQRERDELQKQLDDLSHPAPKNSVQLTDEVETARTVDLSKLNELEEGIKGAQESYQKIEAKLKANNTKIEDLARANQRLRLERCELEMRCRDLKDALQRAEHKLKEALMEVDFLREQLASKSGASPFKLEAGPEVVALKDFVANTYEPEVAALKLEVQRLTQENQALEEEKEHYQHDLEVTSLRLKKIKTSDLSLRENLAKLSEMRQKSGHSRTSSIVSGNQLVQSSVKSDTSSMKESLTRFRSISTSLQLVGSPSERSQRSRRASASLQQPSRNTLRGTAPTIDLTRVDQDVEDEAPTPRPAFHFPSTLDVLPLTRRSELAHLPTIAPTVAIDESENLFSRERMIQVLGSSHQPLIDKASKENDVFKGKDIRSYLCPGQDRNPWCPTVPGQHGYIFVGLGREASTFSEPETHNVFSGIKKGKDTRRFRYLGKYQAVRVNPLTVAEWQTLDLKVRTIYAKTTRDKNKDPRSVDEILSAYDSGELMVPCVKLQCIGFDTALYQSMLGRASEYPKPRASLSSISSNKRALEEYGADAETSVPKRRSRNRA